jgi:hypothetical protein
VDAWVLRLQARVAIESPPPKRSTVSTCLRTPCDRRKAPDIWPRRRPTKRHPLARIPMTYHYVRVVYGLVLRPNETAYARSSGEVKRAIGLSKTETALGTSPHVGRPPRGSCLTHWSGPRSVGSTSPNLCCPFEPTIAKLRRRLTVVDGASSTPLASVPMPGICRPPSRKGRKSEGGCGASPIRDGITLPCGTDAANLSRTAVPTTRASAEPGSRCTL